MSDTSSSFSVRLSESVSFLVIARLAMIITPVLLISLATVAGMYMNDKFEKTNQVETRVDVLQKEIDDQTRATTALADRVLTIETSRKSNIETQQAFQTSLSSDIRDMRSALVSISNNLAGLTATVDLLKERNSNSILNQKY
jgi:hypothetical protein